MTIHRTGAILLALGSLAALPACSSDRWGGQASAAPPAQSQLSPHLVMQVQSSLQQQGMYNGVIDGMWGPQTQQAVRAYQQAHGMAATGELNQRTLAALTTPPPAGMPTSPPMAAAPAPMAPAPVAAAAPPASATTTQ